jgi:proline iminopeptidase
MPLPDSGARATFVRPQTGHPMIRASLLTSVSIALATACAKPAPPVEGYIQVPGGKIYYARMGNGPGTPLIVIHGGPGSGSYANKPFGALGDDRPVIRYDQLGSGKADHPTDTTLFTVDRAVKELQALRDSLGLTEVHLLGQSWGGMLLEAYMGSHPKGVKSVTFLSPLVTTAQWEQDADSLIKTLADSVQQAIKTNEANHTTDSPAYQAATMEYYRHFVFRKPMHIPGADTASHGELVYGYMWGPSEFTSTGTLKTFDGTGWLKEIRVPALFMAGEFDEATPSSTEKFSKLVPNAQFKVIPGSGHVSQNDNPDFMLGAVREFLRSAEGRHR